MSSKIKDSQSELYRTDFQKVQNKNIDSGQRVMALDSEQAQQFIVKIFWYRVSNIKSLGHSMKSSIYLSKILCRVKYTNAFLLSILSSPFLFIFLVAFLSSVWITPSSVYWKKYRN